MSYRVKISGTGHYVPETVVTNDDLSKTLDTNDEWIRSRTGIAERRYVAEGQAASDLAAEAARRAIAAAGLDKSQIGMILVATVTADHRIPCTAALVQRHLDIEGANGFDIVTGCTGFVHLAQTASQFIRSGAYEHVLMIGADVMTSIINPTERATRVLFGDGAGAAVLSRAAEGEESDLLAMTGGMAGNDEFLVIPGGGSRKALTPEALEAGEQYVTMKGRAVFRFAVDRFTAQIVESCEAAGVSPSELKLVVPHQVNLRILESAARRAEVSMERVVVNLDRFGNTAAASIGIALDESIVAGRLERGDLVLLVSFGAGLAWASALFRY